ncbi:MAG: hypothetical protein ABIT83_07315, partial [Massilia sp.]
MDDSVKEGAADTARGPALRRPHARDGHSHGHPHGHRIGPSLRKELSDWRLWWARATTLLVAILAGLAVVGFTWLTERALDGFLQLRLRWWWAPLLWTPLCTALIVAATRRWAPGAAGSGIPQVMAALEPSVDA